MIMNFNYYLENELAKKKNPDMAEAHSLIKKAEGRLKFSIRIRKIDDNTATYIFEDIYECMREAAQSLMSVKGYKPYSHEALIAFLREFFEFPESDMRNFDRYRILRNNAVYRGEKISAGVCKESLNFLEAFLPQTEKELEKLLKPEKPSKKGSAKIYVTAIVLFIAIFAISASAFQATGNSYDLKYEIGDAGGNGSSANVDITFLATQNAIGIFSQTLNNLWAGPQCIFNTPPNISVIGTNVTGINTTTAMQISGLINDTDGSAVRLVVFKANNNEIACTGSNATNGNSTCNFIASALGCSSEGTCTVRVYAQESEIGVCSGQDFSPSFLTVSFTYDVTIPSISQIWPNTTSVGYAKNNTLILINFTFTEANPKNFSASVYNSTATICNRDNTSFAAGANQQVTANCTIASTASDANYSVRVILFDTTGQFISNTQTDAFQLDSTVPSAANVTVNETVTVSGTRYAKFAIPLNATASDNAGGSGIGYVEFYANSTLIGNDTTSPYGISWNTATLADGRYNLTIKAYDRAGNLLSVG